MNSKRCIENIRFLAKEKNLKIGEIEKGAGVSPGYLSRFTKEDATSMPSVEVLAAFAKATSVTIDSLIYMDYPKLSPSDRFILTFLQELTAKTSASEATWTVQQSDCLYETNYYSGVPSHPLFRIERGEHDATVCYHSEFRDYEVSLSGNSYKLQIGSDTDLHLMSVIWDQSPNKDRQEYELYFVKNDSVTPLCHSVSDGFSPFNDVLKVLYAEAAESTSHIHLSDSVKEALDAYLKTGSADTESFLPF